MTSLYNAVNIVSTKDKGPKRKNLINNYENDVRGMSKVYIPLSFNIKQILTYTVKIF